MGQILAIIPARYGSKRIPNKNFVDLNGKPLIEYSIISARACAEIDIIVVTSDAADWASRITDMGALYIDRPEELCQDDTTDLPVIQHALEAYGSDIDLICYLRPTTPFRALYHIEHAIKYMRDAGDNATGLRSVEVMGESAFKCYTMLPGYLEPKLGFLTPIYYPPGFEIVDDMTDRPNQEVEKTYKPNGYIDICKPETIAAGSLWGDAIIGYVTPRTIEIDTKEDLEYARWWSQRERPMIHYHGRAIQKS